LTEALTTIQSLPSGAYLESNGLVVMEAENGDIANGATHNWLRLTALDGYTGTSYVQTSPDIDALYQPSDIISSPVVAYPINVTTPETYTLWLRGYPANAAGDSAYVGLNEQTVEVTGFTPGEWTWANTTTAGVTATLAITTSDVYTVNLLMREDGLRLDRLLLTTDTTFIPTGFGPAETERQLGGGVSATGQAVVETAVVNFTAEPLTGIAPLTVTFTNLATPTGVINSFEWAYGDGFTQTTSAVTHTHPYTQAGVYTVSLTATAGNDSRTLTRTNYITVTNDVITSALAINKTAPALAGPGELITYTLTITNSSNVTATNLLITDTLPISAYYVEGGTLNGNVISWTWPTLPPISHTTVQFVVTATETISNVDYGVSADGGLSATGDEAIITLIGLPLTVTATNPLSNGLIIANDSVISATFSGAIDPGTVTTRTFTVRGQQTGVYEGSYDTATNQARFDAVDAFKPGEQIVTTLSRGVESSGGIPLIPHTWQFRAETLGGTGVFTNSGQSLGSGGVRVALGDLDSDGDLDSVWASQETYEVWLNDGAGSFTDSGQTLGDLEEPALALGDLNGDGHLDILANDGGTRVWLNDGTGVFTDSGHSLGLPVDQAVLGDLDGDGDLDVMKNGLGTEIWLNDSTGVFTESNQVLEPINFVSHVALGDLNNDGTLDALLGTDEDGSVWFNDGNGTFAEGGQIPSGASDWTTDASLADLNGDGNLDVVLTRLFSDAYMGEVWLNEGDGSSFTQTLTMGNSFTTVGIAVGDIDGDDDQDLVVIDYSGDNEIWQNNGDGTFSLHPLQSLEMNTNRHTIALGDVDGDGDLDALIGGSQDNQLWLNQDQLSLTKTAPAHIPAGQPITYTLTIRNLSNFTATNLLITDTLPISAYYVEGGTLNGNVISWTRPTLPPISHTTVQFVVTATETISNVDYGVSADGGLSATGDEAIITLIGVPLTVTTTSPLSNGLIIANDSVISATFSRAIDPGTVTTRTFTVRGQQTGIYEGSYDTGTNQARFEAADAFKPGEPIVTTLSRGVESSDGIPLTPHTWQFRAQTLGGTGVFTNSGQSLGSGGEIVRVGDLDSDGDLDTVWVNNDTYQIWLNDSGVFTDSGQTLGDLEESALALGDLNGDGHLDIVVEGEDPRIWLNDGAGVFTDSGYSLGLSTGEVVLGDLDGDGDLDIVTNGFGAEIWLNDGTGLFNESNEVLEPSDIVYSVALGDLNNDGTLDAVLGTEEDGSIWFNDGTGTFTEGDPILLDDLDWNEDITIADLNGDGNLDAVLTYESGEGL
jgi:uncharacterized repeat protein (TIGR01451 family)